MSLYYHSSRWKSLVVGIAAIEPKWQHTDSVRSYRLKRAQYSSLSDNGPVATGVASGLTGSFL